jgi:threonylcarbamoyladenosine tRNA methylthiotransferase MtaB
VSGTVAFYTLGCKLNFSETSTIGQQFLKNGYQIVEFDQPADVYVINTCSVTSQADRECKQIARRALRINPEGFVIVTGCYAQLKPEEISGIDGVDLVLGNNEKFDIFKYSDNFRKNELSCVRVSQNDEVSSVHIAYSTDADSRTRAFLKIQDGCDYKCSYCTIPKARGFSRSIESSEIAESFETLVRSGYHEVVLTGVNIGDYGKGADTDFYGLLWRLTEINGDYRMRIGSVEPNLLTDKILELAASTDKICSHFHIPLQSGSKKILRLMQRRYKK